MTNALTCSDDAGQAGLPYHVVLRGLFDCDSTQAGLGMLRGVTRASSANYLLADSSGHLLDVEARPGDADAIHQLTPDASGCVSHTNHFAAADFAALDYTAMVESTSRTRLAQITSTVSGPEARPDLASYETVLTDHTHAPDCVCRHVDPTEPLEEQSVTVAAALVDLIEPAMLVAAGPPCQTGFTPISTPW
jgi:isopenicillin-N N-acyltransferase-like protein